MNESDFFFFFCPYKRSFPRKNRLIPPQGFAVTHNLHSMTLVQIQDGTGERDCFTRYIMLQSLSLSLSSKNTHPHTHLDVLLFCFFVISFSIYIFKIYVMYMYSIWKQIGNLQWSLSSSTYTARKHIHRSNLEGHIERGRKGGGRESEREREREEEEEVWQKRKGANHVEFPDRHGETIQEKEIDRERGDCIRTTK